MFTLLLSRWELFCWMKVEIIGKLPTRRIIEINRKEVSLLPTTKKKTSTKGQMKPKESMPLSAALPQVHLVID